MANLSCQQPTVALAHPLWLSALGLLAVNDHLLKGSGLLPGLLTGKLSDVAGLLVAPVLLAALLGLTRRGVLLAHVAVGGVFAALQLSPVLAGLWDGALTAVGVSWHTTPDPTDLIALPALWLSHRVLVPAMRRPTPVTRSVRLALGGVGLGLCLATSPVREPSEWDTGGFADFEAAVYVHNGTGAELDIEIRTLKPLVSLDCEGVAAAPDVLLPDGLFDTALTWRMPPATNAPVVDAADPGGAGCFAALVRVPGHAETRVFAAGPLENMTISGTHDSPDHVGRGGIAVTLDGDGVARLVAPNDPGLAGPWTPLAEGGSACPVQRDRDRLDWIVDPALGGVHTLVSVAPGADGCHALRFGDVADEVFVCLPLDLFPFVAGDTVELGVSDASWRMTRSDGTSLHLTRRSLQEVEGLVLRGGEGPLCGPVYEAACAEVAGTRDLDLVRVATGTRLGGLSVQGERRLELEDPAMTVALVHHEHRLAIDGSCDPGPGIAGPDLEWVVLRHGGAR